MIARLTFMTDFITAVDAEKKSKAQAQKEANEASKWEDGAKDNKKKQSEEQKRQEALAKKKERYVYRFFTLTLLKYSAFD